MKEQSIETLEVDGIVVDLYDKGLYGVLKTEYNKEVSGHEVHIMPGFIFNGASIPKFARKKLGGKWTKQRLEAALVHDYA